MDAFIAAVEDARRELIRQEGRNVSVRELIRRAGFPDSRRASVAAHLNPRIARPRGHRVPPDIVRGLVKALSSVVSEEELARAASAAAGFTVVDAAGGPDVPTVVARFYGDQAVSEEEKAAVTARLLQIIAEETSRNARTSRQNVSETLHTDDHEP